MRYGYPLSLESRSDLAVKANRNWCAAGQLIYEVSSLDTAVCVLSIHTPNSLRKIILLFSCVSSLELFARLIVAYVPTIIYLVYLISPNHKLRTNGVERVAEIYSKRARV